MRGALSSLPRHRGIQPRSSQHLFEGKRLSEITNLRKPLPSHLLTSACRARAPLGLPGGLGFFVPEPGLQHWWVKHLVQAMLMRTLPPVSPHHQEFWITGSCPAPHISLQPQSSTPALANLRKQTPLISSLG